jgi:DNA modification methylase
MKPYYEHAGITIYHGDCRDVMEQWEGLRTQSFDLLLTDPPYDIKWTPRVNRDADWRDEHVVLAPWLMLCRKACIWGGNYFTDQVPVSEAWLLWMKRPSVGFDQDRRTFSVAEMAWSNYGGHIRALTHVWDGGKRQGHHDNRQFLHPCQKPLEVMAWCLIEAGSDVLTVIDPFMGSGTTLVACKRLGRSCTGIEREERYCEIAAKRLAQEVLPLEMAI